VGDGRRVIYFHEHNQRLWRCPCAAAGTPAEWVTEEVTPIPKNHLWCHQGGGGDLCELFHRKQGLACIVLRTSRFFPEADDSQAVAGSLCG